MENSTEPASPPGLPPDSPQRASCCRFNPWLFFGVLSFPALATVATLLFADGEKNYGERSLLVMIVTSVVAGIVCGIHFARAQRQLSAGIRWVVGAIAVVGCAGVSAILAFGGCLAVARSFGSF